MENELLIIFILVGVILIQLFAFLINRKRNYDGVIVINTDDPDKDTYRIEIMIPFGELNERKDVRFKINKE